MSKNESLAVIIDSDAGCDESKCVSHGLSWLFQPLLLTCYSSDDFPIACSHGYKPHIVDSEPVIWNELTWEHRRNNSMLVMQV